MAADILQQLQTADTSLFFILNGAHCSFFDSFMMLFTGKLIWVPMYASIIYLLVRNYDWRRVLMCLVTIGLIMACTDYMCNSLLRPIVQRIRPSGEGSPIADMVYVVNGMRGGGYGFPSCHASNSFGLAVYIMLLFRHRGLSVFFLCWALMNCYTRIYLGLHYPGDILSGILLGCLSALLFCSLLHRFSPRPQAAVRQAWVPMAVGGLTLLHIVVVSALPV
jgi:undecaprenyl-diphosphatase